MAKRITREMANEAAKQLASIAFDKKVQQAMDKEREFGDYLVKTYIPQPIQGVMKEYRSWFQHMDTSLSCIDASRQSRRTLYIQTNILIHYYLRSVPLSYEDFKKADQLHQNYLNLNDKRNAYTNEVSNALMQLKSEARIKEHFPEALPYLNFSESTALIPQFEHLRSLLKQ